jgi:pimeloyl-ACP methyl ester carboxylesterase
MRGDPDGPSYIEAMTAAGYATLAIDRLGAGRSSRPPSSRFGNQTHEFVIHQVIQRLRAGAIGGRAFERVILVGNSLGSTLARMVAVRFPGDADGLILTGETSTPNWAAFAAHEADYLPASQDPRFAGQDLDAGGQVPRVLPPAGRRSVGNGA